MFNVSPKNVFSLGRLEGEPVVLNIRDGSSCPALVDPVDVNIVLASLRGDEDRVSAPMVVDISKKTGIPRRGVWEISKYLLEILERMK